MKAFILCGGQGTRLREQTDTRPKPMVEIGGRPILWHIMKTYAHYGVTDFVLCLGYKSHLIKDYFLNYEAQHCDFTVTLGPHGAIEVHGTHHDEDGWRVTLVDTGENAMTGARIKRAASFLDTDDETFFVTYGDGLIDVDLRKTLAFHKSHNGAATITAVRPPSRYGELTHVEGRVLCFDEKPQVSEGSINGGYLVLDRSFLDYLWDDDACTLEDEPMQRAVADGQLFVYEHSGYWQCMDTYRDWLQLEERWTSGQAPWKVWR